MRQVEPKQKPIPAGGGTEISSEVQHEILGAIAAIGFGSVEVVIHNFRVVHVETRKKLRFAGSEAPLR